MEKVNFSFEIPAFEAGKTAGTVAWLNLQLKRIKFEQGHTKKTGLPCLFFYFENEPSTRVGAASDQYKQSKYVFCTLDEEANRVAFRNNLTDPVNRILCVHPDESENVNNHFGLFDYLNANAYKIAKEFIAKVSYAWIKQYDEL